MGNYFRKSVKKNIPKVKLALVPSRPQTPCPTSTNSLRYYLTRRQPDRETKPVSWTHIHSALKNAAKQKGMEYQR